MATKEVSRLGAGLIARKGEATPAPVASVVEPAVMANDLPVNEIVKESGLARGLQGTTSVTVRLDSDRYERMKIYGAKNRLTNQTIIVAALDSYFKDRP
jgi:hypothetical protein